MKKYVLSLLPAILMMVVIFIFSSKTAVESDDSSMSIVGEIVNIYEKLNGEIHESERNDIIEKLNLIIRKGAHITEYAILAMLLGIHFVTINATVKQYFILNISICVLYAMTDEFHQLFVEGRSGQISDVCIDSIGVVLGSILFYLLARKKFSIPI